jgi:hypothetical protein
MSAPVRADAPGVVTDAVHEGDLLIVARVAEREGWHDIDPPAGAHPPRTIAEQAAVARVAALTDAPGRRVARMGRAVRARLVTVAVVVMVLGACWWVSPARTALALLGAGLVCLVAARRRGAPYGPAGLRSPLRRPARPR